MRNFYAIIFFLQFLVSVSGQNLPELIKQRSKAVVSVSSYSVAGTVVDRANGFFISSDGILLMPAFPLSKSDSIIVTLHNGRKLQVEKVLSVQMYYNMAMVKVGGSRDFEFLTPEKRSIREPEEVLVLVHESAGAVSQVGRILKVEGLPDLVRMGTVSTNIGSASSGAPVINVRGNLIGVFLDNADTGSDCVLSSLFIPENSWTTVNTTPRKLYADSRMRLRLRSDFVDGMKAACSNSYGDASRYFSYFITNTGEDPKAYSLRAIMRLNYGNEPGWRNDVETLLKVYPTSYSGYYLTGLGMERQGKYAEAFEWYGKACAASQTTGATHLAYGRMVLRLQKDVKRAFDLVSEAVFKDSLLAQAYFERGKLLMQHSSNSDKALADISQAIYLDPNIEGIFTVRGTFFFDKQNYSVSILDFNEALKRKPSDMHALLNRGVAYYNLGLKDKACEDWDKASRLGNDRAYKFISRYCANSLR